ncbi:methyl-accepting chemotaxis protein [Paenibacillus barcinonensis]|uniref:Methyl-accepting chemotaxis protein n=1 Tax=Paenibacillus barcinonensis TaxID=198119 RepID=A0A2V4UTA2_PAEBA|nr:methyl-accepting chemotaxis protein [Paenibacillus barcinonensis]PYE42389.1 methyl-accepting chemotaxis sensory transducer with Cache sensor [Paenibacillus barcinonensis]QKS58085.1 methyl-accepting chemotaxis protein [Paenibacillus barcinonensis]
MKLKPKLMMMFLTAVLISALPLALVGLVQTEKQATRNVNSTLKGIMASSAKQLDGWLSSNAKVIETLGLVIEDGVPEGALTENYFNIMNQGSNKENLSDLYFGSEKDGTFMNGSDWSPDAGYDSRKRPWYEQAKKADALSFSDPYQDMMSKEYAVSIAMPVHNKEGVLEGVVAGDLLLSTLTDTVKKIDLNGLGYSFLIDKHGLLLAHPDVNMVNTSAKDNPEFSPMLAEMQNHASGQQSFHYNGEDYLLFYNQIPSTGWVIGSVITEKLAYGEFYELRNNYILIIGATLLVVLAWAYWVATLFIKPLKQLHQTSIQMSEGDFTGRVKVKGKDEFAELGNAFNQMSDQLGALLRQVSGSAERVHTISEVMQEHTDNTKRIAEQISIATDELAQGSSTQAESVYTGSSRLTEMSDNVGGINRSVEQSVVMMREAGEAMLAGLQAVEHQVELADGNRHSMDRVGESITLLTDKSQKIEGIVAMIQGIASQTNLLALNASIEAARAGEHGRGFAVVAEEVRKLAEQSANSAKEIIVLLEEIQTASGMSAGEVHAAEQGIEQQVAAVHEMRESFVRIKQSIDGIESQLKQVSSATTELDDNAGKVAEIISSVAAMSEQSAASTEEVASSTQEQFNYITSIAERSNELAEQSKTLAAEVKKFKV